MQIFSDELHDKVTDLIEWYKQAKCKHEMDLVEIDKLLAGRNGNFCSFSGPLIIPESNYETCKKGCGFVRYL